jgi:amidase
MLMKPFGKASRHCSTMVQAAGFFILLMILNGPAVLANDQLKSGPDKHEIIFMTASRIEELILAHKVTSAEVVEAYIEQIKRVNPKLNAIVTLDEEGARKRAREADEALAKGIVWGPLHGVPVTIKDNYATMGIRSTNSDPKHADFIPDFDATVVERMKNAGAVILGKENLPMMAMDYQTNSPVFGLTNNPWDVSRTPGGSTGGGGAAVASGMTTISLGNDLGGSIRIPSHFCGVYGMKPTEHLVSGFGIPPYLPKAEFNSVRHLISEGPLARSIDDLKLCLKVIAGPDTRDVNVPFIPLVEPQQKPLNELHIAWTDNFGDIPVSADTRRALKEFAEKLSAQGCTVEKLNPPDFNFAEAWNTYGKIMDMELGVYSPAFARVLTFAFGWYYRKDVPFLATVYPISFEKYVKALTERDTYVSRMESFLSQYDAWLCPVTATPAYAHIRPDRYFGPYPLYSKPVMVDDRPVNYLAANGCYTTIFNLTGNPVIVMPIGYARDGMPIGIQVVGSRWRDMGLLTVAKQLDEVAKAFRTPVGY